MKRLVSITLSVLIALSLSLPSSAVTSSVTYYDDLAQRLSQIGVFKGTGNGFELDRAPTRLEGLVMLIRLLGKESDALNMTNLNCAFTDVPAWGVGYVNYAYVNGLTNGIGNNLFGSNDRIDSNSYITLLLRALGYDDSTKTQDFTWSDAVNFGKSIGLVDEDLYARITGNTFIRDHVAKVSYSALIQPLKASSVTLIQKLISDGAIEQGDADLMNGSSDIKSPANVKMTQATVDTVTVYWDSVPDADYYYVYKSNTSATSGFKVMADTNGPVKLNWAQDVCIYWSGLTLGETYYVKVAAVKGNEVSIPSFAATVTMTSLATMTLDECKAFMINKYSTGYFTGVSFDDIYLEDSPTFTYALMYLNVDSINPFASSAYSSKLIIEYQLISVCKALSENSGKDVILAIVYTGDFSSYPSTFADNLIYKDTISQGSEPGTWSVFYPFVQMTYTYTKGNYVANAQWAFNIK